MKKKMLGMILAAAMAAGSLAGCGGAAPEATQGTAGVPAVEQAAQSGGGEAPSGAATGGTLKVALTNSFTGACAINTATPYRFASFSQVYESLLSLNEDEYEGILLKEWKQSEPGVWELTLFDGIVDSEGNPFTSEDVRWALNAQWDSGHDLARFYSKDCVEVVDDTHMTMTLGTDSEGVFYLMATQILLCTEEAYMNSSDHLATMPIGTGPYKCTSYVEGSSSTLEKRDDYWKSGELPRASVANYDKIEISYVSEVTQMAIAIESGDIDLAGQVNMSISSDADNAAGMKTVYMKNGTYNGLSFNSYGRVISDNLALREAVCLAIDSNGLIQSVYQGHAKEMPGYGIDTAIDFDASWTCGLGYDPEKAKEKLKEAGYENGVELVLLSNNVGEDSQLSELIQGYLAAVGITVTMDYVDPATKDPRIAEGNWDLCLVGGIGVLDMSLFWGNLYNKQDTGMSKYFHNDPALYDIFDEYYAVGGKTDENLQAIYEYEKEHVTWYPMFNKEILYAFKDSYSGLTVNEAYMALPYLGTLK